MDKKVNCRFKSRSELAAMFGISLTTLRKYMNIRYFDELTALGYVKSQRVIQPRVYEWLIQHLGYSDDVS